MGASPSSFTFSLSTSSCFDFAAENAKGSTFIEAKDLVNLVTSRKAVTSGLTFKQVSSVAKGGSETQKKGGKPAFNTETSMELEVLRIKVPIKGDEETRSTLRKMVKLDSGRWD